MLTGISGEDVTGVQVECRGHKMRAKCIVTKRTPAFTQALPGMIEAEEGDVVEAVVYSEFYFELPGAN